MKNGFKKYITFLAGIIILTLGVSLTVKTDLGASPYDAVNFVLAEKWNLSVTVTIYGTAAIDLIISSILRWNRPRITSFITSLFMGFFTGVWVEILDLISLTGMGIRVIVFIIGTFLMCVGISLYLLPGLPPTPIDDLMVALHDRFGIKTGTGKLIVDAVCFIIAVILGGSIGIGTVVLVLAVGPTVNLIMPTVKRLLKSDTDTHS